jgi:hypothetical protein
MPSGRFEFLRIMTMTVNIFWDVIPYILVNRY